MITYLFNLKSNGNIILKKFVNFQEIGSIIGRTRNNKGYIHNIFVNESYRRSNHGSDMLSAYERQLKINYNIKEIRLAAWENISKPNSVSHFYNRNGYFINKSINPYYYDDKINIYEIINFYKKI